MILEKGEDDLHELEEIGLWVAGHYDEKSKKLEDGIAEELCLLDVEIFIDSREYSLDERVCLAYQTIKHGDLSCHYEVLELLLNALQCWDSNVRVGYACLDECLRLLVVLALHE